MPFNWKCPICQHSAAIREDDYVSDYVHFASESKYGWQSLRIFSVTCPNAECRKYSLKVDLFGGYLNSDSDMMEKGIRPKNTWSLIPRSKARSFPDYVPKPIRDDYEEACLICNLSPKASSTLARRCLQGIIRDFWSIKKRRLLDEINALEGEIDSLTWQAIDAVRSIGNIGAHMEQDINLIIDVDPDEAVQLINLIEILIEDWYIARHEKQKHLTRVAELAKKKERAKSEDKETQETKTGANPQ